MKIHQIKIDFNVTETVRRFVYVYLIEAAHCWLIDSGVCGAERQIAGYMNAIGRDISDIKGIFLTHAHPDHIGTAAWFREQTGCSVYASEGEKPWIEDIDLQFRERPIPNFYSLAGKPVQVDVTVSDGDAFELEPGLVIHAVGTAGHSVDGMSYRLADALFIGDAVPVKGDIPIFVDEQRTRETLARLEKLTDVKVFYPAWNVTYDRLTMQRKIREARELIDVLQKAVITCDDGGTAQELAKKVSAFLGMPMLTDNPLFARTLACLRERG